MNSYSMSSNTKLKNYRYSQRRTSLPLIGTAAMHKNITVENFPDLNKERAYVNKYAPVKTEVVN